MAIVNKSWISKRFLALETNDGEKSIAAFLKSGKIMLR